MLKDKIKKKKLILENEKKKLNQLVKSII